MFTYEKEVLKQIADALLARFGRTIEGIYAFGSKVRGDHHAESDFDVLIVVNNKTVEIERGIIDIMYDIELEAGVNFAPVIKSKDSFDKEKQYNTPFYHNIMAEGSRF